MNIDNIKNICILFSLKMKENDRIFTNIFKIDRWINRLDLLEILKNFENFIIIQDNILNFSDLLNLTFFCIELANDLDEINVNENYSPIFFQITVKNILT